MSHEASRKRVISDDPCPVCNMPLEVCTKFLRRDQFRRASAVAKQTGGGVYDPAFVRGRGKVPTAHR